MKGIYYILNIKSKKVYIGSSKCISKRLNQHVLDLTKHRHCNIYLQRSWNKDNSIKFIYGILEIMPDGSTRDELLIEEQKYLDVNAYGYNLAPANGGDIISTHPNRNEIRRKIKYTLDKRYANMSPKERKQKYGRPGNSNPNWRNGGISKKLCPECKEEWICWHNKSCSDCMNRSGKNNPFYGKHHTAETKQILREKILEDFGMNHRN